MSKGQIIVLGMHRSGTSCVGNLLTKIGIYFGDHSVSTGTGEENRKGFFERRDMREICDAVLQGSGSDWWAVGDFSTERVPVQIRTEVSTKFATVLEELHRHEPWFVKEPRLCLVWPLLSAQVANPVFVHVWRDPREVAQSLAARNGFPIDFGIALWERYVRSAFLVSRDQCSVILSYNQLLKDPEGETRRLVEELGRLGVSGIAMPSEAELSDAVDADLYRQRDVSSPELAELITPSQRQLVNALAERDAKNPVLVGSLSALSRLRIDDWARREAAIFALRTDALEARRAKAESGRLREDIAARMKQSAVSATKLAELAEGLAASEMKIAELTADIDAERMRAAALKMDLAAKDSKLQQSTAVLRQERTPAHKILFGGISSTLSANPDTPRVGRSLYLHYRVVCRRRDARDLALVAASGLFDAAYYLQHNQDVAEKGLDPLIHYVDIGASKGRDPSPLFSTSYYLEHNPGVVADGINPLLHFVLHGRNEGRNPQPTPIDRSLPPEWQASPAPITTKREAKKPLPGRTVIYSAVAGGYDDLQPPGFRPPDCDFVLFSDQPLQVEGWEVRPFNYVHQDPTRTARFVKLHPHIYFPDYDKSIWIDANIAIRGDFRTLFSRLTHEEFIGSFFHPLRNCIYAEGRKCISLKKDRRQVIRRHLKRYRHEGFPRKAGLWETNVLLRRHNDPGCIRLMDAWWRELEIGSRRDQISLPVVAERLSVIIAPLGERGENVREHPLFALSQHSPARIFPPDAVLPVPVRKEINLDRISVDIGVCVHNSPNEVRACLASLLAARRPQDKIVIVDDASDGPTAALLDEFVRAHEGVRLIRSEQNRGYTRSANDVLRNSQSDWVILLNSDTIVPSEALRKLIVCGEQFSQTGIVGPLSNAASWQTVPKMTGPDGKFLINKIPDPLTVEDMDRICEELSDKIPLFVPLVNGFCYALRRAVTRSIGYFDENSFPLGYGEEDDFCLRAGAAGYLCSIATDAYVYHVKSASFTSERRPLLAAPAAKALRAKHSAERIEATTGMMKQHPQLTRIRRLLAARLQSIAAQERA